ncbi:spore coat protein U [Pseudoxanthomonas kalamensis DSM 18571]|uniref:Csu type fimbrial protein n=1 Tax=Pseudoxanthomonas kalamensis TaxID=289483 RepID=UPI00139113A5|nr:spore coat U domain-containing protein [Pseudoxanthomonas kalamensis]KAF1708554.1 spore coat protein U [Pseudoxanthomonas kalamensis DSM 18571]
MNTESLHSETHPASRALPVRAWLLAVLALCALVLAPRPAAAQSCWINGSMSIDFGTVTSAGKDTSNTLGFTCSKPGLLNAAYRVCLFIPEGSPIPGVNPRWLTNYNGGQMAYDLYSDAARTQIIGPYGSGYPTYSSTFSISGLAYQESNGTLPIYGRAHAGQSLPAAYAYASQISNSQLRYSYNATIWPFSVSAPSVAECLSGGGSGSGIVSYYTGVAATFANTCHIVVASDMDFGTAPALTGNVDQTSTIQLECPVGTSWQVRLDNGNHATGNTRRMASGGNFVTYNLYRNAARTQRWGNNNGSDVDGSGNGATQTLTVYGRVPAQAAVSGTYTDTITVTLVY